MSTATAEPEVIGAIVQQPDKAVLFVARRTELRLVKEGRYPIVVPTTGQRIGETRGVTVSFAPEGEFRCPEKGEVTIMDPGGAGRATLRADDYVDENGQHVQGLLNWLQTHERCGDPNEGFMRLDPKAPPIGQQEHKALVTFATKWDVDGLRAIIEAEREGWNRKELIEVAQGALEQIQAAEDRIRAEVEAEQQAAAGPLAEERAVNAESKPKPKK